MSPRRSSLKFYPLGFPVPVFTVLAFVLLTSCASRSDLKPAAAIASESTPTPFQPGVYDSPFNAPLSPSPADAATFTPYPTVYVQGVPLVLPDVATPSGNADFYSLKINPITGNPPSDPALLERRPIAIKVANYPRYIRPQSGLTLADAVFEYYIESLLTRFIAVYYGNDAQQVGPVRSGRYFDEHVMRMYRAFYVFKYADPREYTYFKGGDIVDLLVVPGFGACPPFFSGKRKIESYNNAYFNTIEWKNCAAAKGLDNSQQTLRSGFFSPDTPAGGSVVSRIFTRYSVDDYNYWEYDPGSGRYLRFQETDDTRNNKPEKYAPLMDDLTKQQVAADNVVELFVSHTFANQFEQQDEVYRINLVNSGNAFVFRNGFAFPARWVRTDLDQPLFLSTLAGAPIYLKPGVTFYQVIGETSSDWADGLDWHFDFRTP
ncbi:MAG: DUF3048 domain-containing protein [Chloroflexi bacterium]|nr:DUF3048 domain-containing protein [Chloroflexota bacterium]